MSPASIDRPVAAPGTLGLRPPPAGLSDVELQPPTIAAAGDPFTAARVIRLVACLDRGRPLRVDDIAAALNARHLDWAFRPAVVTDVLLQLQANWMVDYRNGSGIVVGDGPYGASLTIEDFEPRRPVDRPPARARAQRLPGGPRRLQPPRRERRR